MVTRISLLLALTLTTSIIGGGACAYRINPQFGTVECNKETPHYDWGSPSCYCGGDPDCIPDKANNGLALQLIEAVQSKNKSQIRKLADSDAAKILNIQVCKVSSQNDRDAREYGFGCGCPSLACCQQWGTQTPLEFILEFAFKQEADPDLIRVLVNTGIITQEFAIEHLPEALEAHLKQSQKKSALLKQLLKKLQAN